MAVKNRDVTWIKENINSSVRAIPNIHYVATTDLNGKVISQSGDVPEFTDKLSNPAIVDKLKNKREFTGLFQTSKGLAVIAASIITDDNGTAEPTGILIFGRILDNHAINEIKDTMHDDIAVLTENGTLLTTSLKVDKNQLSTYLSKLNSDLHIYKTSESGSIENAQLITTLKDFTNKPIGVLYINQKQKTSTSVKSNLFNVSLFIGVIFMIILALLSFLVYWHVIKPIQQFVSVSENVAKGNLKLEINDKLVNHRDELGKLGNSLNVMISNFRKLIKDVAETIEQVASSSEELSLNSEGTTKAANQIVSAISEVASGAETQLQGALESSQAIEEMTQGIQHISDTMSIVSSNSEKTEQEAEKGNKSIQLAIGQMEKINQSFEESTNLVNQLNERSKEIGQMAALITSIADQTNLLALNAAIEAARAGEQGRGFAVVAEEVRKLAEQAAISAKHVKEMVNEIEKDTISSVHSMDNANIEVDQGLKQIHEVGNVFERILLAAQNVVQQTTEVSAVAEEMAASSQQVASSVERMADVATNSASFSKNVAVSSEEQLASMKEIAHATDYLAKMAQKLEILINKFVI